MSQDQRTTAPEKGTPADAGAELTPVTTVLAALARALREQPTGRQILDGLDELGELSVCDEDPREIAATVAALCYLARIPAPAPAGPFRYYRADHEGIVADRYTTAAEAQRHCEALISREHPPAASVIFLWLTDEDQDPTGEPDDPMAVAELVVMVNGGPEVHTGYTVTPVEVAAAYDPDADE
ncbi:hypothetical protein ACWCQM_07055 [Streptomyces sp. NPDC002125]